MLFKKDKNLTDNTNHVATIFQLYFISIEVEMNAKVKFQKKLIIKKISYDAEFTGHSVYTGGELP